MPEEDGFAFAENVPFDVPIVFVTAYSISAVVAFEVAALDYVLKPVDPLRLAEALNRVAREVRRRSSTMAPIRQVSAANSTTGQEVSRLQVSGGARFVPASAIVCIVARDDYTEVFLEEGTSELVHVTLSAFRVTAKDSALWTLQPGTRPNVGVSPHARARRGLRGGRSA